MKIWLLLLLLSSPLLAARTALPGLFIVDDVGKLFQAVQWHGEILILEIATPFPISNRQAISSTKPGQFNSPWGQFRIAPHWIVLAPPSGVGGQTLKPKFLPDGHRVVAGWIDQHRTNYIMVQGPERSYLHGYQVHRGPLSPVVGIPSELHANLAHMVVAEDGNGVITVSAQGVFQGISAQRQNPTTNIIDVLEPVFFNTAIQDLAAGTIASFDTEEQLGTPYNRALLVIAGNYQRIARVLFTTEPSIDDIPVPETFVNGPAMKLISTEFPDALNRIRNTIALNQAAAVLSSVCDPKKPD